MCTCTNNHRIKLLENGNVIVHASTVLLRHTLRYPDNISAFLFFKFQIRVEYTVMELTHECIDIQLHFMFKETIFKSFFTRISASTIKQSTVFSKVFSYSFDLKVIK